ncbi:MAG: CAP domain-containing protein [Acidobacteria bacterium]|nr:MAG: CAP domain-containing protein [Acidobacteriota bacterium]
MERQRPPIATLLPATLLGAFLALALLVGPGASTAAAAGCPGSDAGPRKISNETAARAIVCLVNKERRRHGLGRLKFHGELERAARGHTKRMQKRDCFDHVCPGERSLVGRYEKADYLPCRCSWGAGENIAWGAGRKGSPRRIVNAWMHSPPHRANILRGSFQHAGVGVRWGSPTRRGANAGTYTLDFGYKR